MRSSVDDATGIEVTAKSYADARHFKTGASTGELLAMHTYEEHCATHCRFAASQPGHE